MSRQNAETREIREALQRLCEAELAGDTMICHDGGFRYSGDFMSMEQEILEPAPLVSDTLYTRLLDAGYIEELDPHTGRAAGFKVTDRGRAVAFGEDAGG